MKLYVCGPMTGIEEFNYPAFHEAQRKLAALGYETENPANNEDGQPRAWHEWLRLGLAQLLRCDGVALLPGWVDSQGAQLETYVAHKLGMPVLPLERWLDVDTLAQVWSAA